MQDKQTLAKIAIELAKKEKRMIYVKSEKSAKKVQRVYGGAIVEVGEGQEWAVHFGLD